MNEYLVEHYISKTNSGTTAAECEPLHRAAAELTSEGTPVRLLRSIVVPDDETCFLLFEAVSADVVREAARRAGVVCEHLAEASKLTIEGEAMSTVTETIRNGVDTEAMFGTLDAIKAQPELGTFRFRAKNRWIDGSHNRTTIKDFYGAGQEDTSRATESTVDAGEPAILLGTDTGPNPAEYLLHALAACLTTSLVYVAAARGVKLTKVESTLEGDMDVQGALGLSDEYRNGFEQIRVSFHVEGEASDDKLREVIARAAKRSAVFDMVTNGVPVHVDVVTG